MKAIFNISTIIFCMTQVMWGQHTFDQRYNTNRDLYAESEGTSLFETDQYYIVHGSVRDNGYNPNVWPRIPDTVGPMFMVLDKQGNELFNPKFRNNSCTFYCQNYIQTTQGEFIGVGHTFTPGDICFAAPDPIPPRERMYLHKLDQEGNLIWKKNYGDTLNDNNFIGAHDIALMDDGNYILFAERNFSPSILKMNEQGELLWEKTLQSSSWAGKHNIEPIDDGYLCFIGYSILKLNKQGDSVWTKYHNAPLNEIKTTSNKEILITSNSGFREVGEGFGVWVYRTRITRIDQNAEILWQRDYYLHAHEAITETRNGDIVIATTNFARIDPEGNILWKRRLEDNGNGNAFYDVMETRDGGFLLTGKNNSNNTILVKTDCQGNLEWSNESCLLPTEEEVLVFPNPVQNELVVQLPQIADENVVDFRLYTTTGQLISSTQTLNQKIFVMPMQYLSSGIYFYHIVLDGKVYRSGKFIKE